MAALAAFCPLTKANRCNFIVCCWENYQRLKQRVIVSIFFYRFKSSALFCEQVRPYCMPHMPVNGLHVSSNEYLDGT